DEGRSAVSSAQHGPFGVEGVEGAVRGGGGRGRGGSGHRGPSFQWGTAPTVRFPVPVSVPVCVPVGGFLGGSERGGPGRTGRVPTPSRSTAPRRDGRPGRRAATGTAVDAIEAGTGTAL